LKVKRDEGEEQGIKKIRARDKGLKI